MSGGGGLYKYFTNTLRITSVFLIKKNNPCECAFRVRECEARQPVGADSFMHEGKEFGETSEIDDDELRRILEIVERDERRERERLEWDNSPEGQAEISRQIKDLLERYDVDDGETEETFLSFDARPFFDYFDSIEFPA